MFDELTCEARVRFRGKDLALNKIIARIDLEEILPSWNPPMTPADMADHVKRDERRHRFVDMLASEFAHALTEALHADLKRV